MKTVLVALLVALVAFAASSASAARRPATATERATVLRAAAEAWPRVPARCLLVYVSTVQPRFASVGFDYIVASCARWAANGLTIVHRQAGRWVDVYDGSDPPVCGSLVPPAVTRDLFRARCLSR